jgi:predicted 2-oxoglutarate/Fe(II)-dependent dioxygenase YbiX
MNNAKEYFDNNGYVVLTGALTAEVCQQMVQYMFDAEREGKTVRDEQCPLSDAIYGAPPFDELLQQMAKPIGEQLGKELLPTYTYARIYRPGEVLKKHTDRPACEISATITLGFDAPPVWPIYVDNDKRVKLDVQVGDMVVYKGTEVVHWRDEFKGQWHVQVFLHYVDANGPYKHEYMDGRSSFGVDKQSPQNQQVQQNAKDIRIGGTAINFVEDERLDNQQQQQQGAQTNQVKNPIYNSIIIPSSNDEFVPGYLLHDRRNAPDLVFTEQECNDIVSIAKRTYPIDASVGGSDHNSAIEKRIRSAKIYDVPLDERNKWIYDKVIANVAFANKHYFDYEIAGLRHGLQLIEYNVEEEYSGHYEWHTDFGTGDPSTRKISVVVQLTNPSDYEGCELLVNDHAGIKTATKERGTVHLFPSYMPHKVTPITRGTRYSLVIWVHGSRRFR